MFVDGVFIHDGMISRPCGPVLFICSKMAIMSQLLHFSFWRHKN